MKQTNLDKKPGMIQVRKRDSADGKWWSPQRDITTLFHKLLRETFYDLGESPDDWPPAVLAVRNNLSISDDDIRNAAKTYAKIVSCVMKRGENLTQAIDRSGFCHHKVNALIGMMMLDKLTRFFVECYGTTLHQGEADPNHRDLSECLELLKLFNEES